MSMRLDDSREAIAGSRTALFREFWSEKTTLEKRLLVVTATLVIFSISLFVSVIVVGVKKERPSYLYESAKTCNCPDMTTVNYGTTDSSTDNSTTNYHSTDDSKVSFDCDTPRCLRYSLSILEAMNLSADPCEDFYLYACGNYIINKEVTERPYTAIDNLNADNDELILKILTQSEETEGTAIGKARKMYGACINEDQYGNQTSVLELLEKYGGWTALDGVRKQNRSWNDVIERMAVGARLGGDDGIIKLTIMPNLKNNSQYLVYIGNPMKQKPLDTSNPDRTAFAIKEILKKLGAVNESEPFLDDIAEGIIKVNDFIKELLKNEKPKDDNIAENVLILTIDELSNLTNCKFNWETYFQILLNTSFPEGYVNGSFLIGVESLDYFQNLCKLDKETGLTDGIDTEKIMDYVTFQLIRVLLKEIKFLKELSAEEQFILEPKIDDLDVSLDKTILCQIPKKNLKCLTLVKYAFSFAIAKELSNKTSAKLNKLTIEKITDEVTDTVKERLQDVDWLQSVTKEEASKKINSLRKTYIYPDWVDDDTTVENYYEKLNISENHFQNIINYLYESRTDRLKLLLEPPKKQLWLDILPSDANAFYSVTENSINILLGILQPPIIDTDRLMAMNYGSLGSIIGHEITHGFDVKGKQFDENGNLRNWWTDSDLASFQKKTACFVEQYNEFQLNQDYIPGIQPLQVNGTLTLSENIADNGGIQQAFKAFKRRMETEGKETPPITLKDFTIEQVFFLSFANLWCANYNPAMAQSLVQSFHSPNPFRVLGSLQNFPEFSKVFNCPKESKMNRGSKSCQLW